jgi:patatin-related protein
VRGVCTIVSKPTQAINTGEAPHPSPDVQPLKELRLAIVCYGGVSLAIYMHGITKEIHKLVTASQGLEGSPDEDPFGGRGSESLYWHALRRLTELQGVRQRVVVDIVSGTSAGGINGVYLAKALAINSSQDALRDMWMGRGDLRELIPYRVPTLGLKIASWAIASAFRRRPRPPLDGDRMLRWLYEALERMDEKTDPVPIPDRSSLIPEDQTLELFVTATDLSGYTRWVWSYSPKQVPDRWHRHVFAFTSLRSGGRLTREHNAALAFAARSTASFPGAFAPVSLADVKRVLSPAGWPGRFADDFASIYALSGADVNHAFFIDGGVLDNFPFGSAIEAIARKPAWSEVDRRLLYVEPDPMVPVAGPEQTGERETLPTPSLPGMMATIWSGLSTIPRHEPILTDLQTVRERNERISQIGDIVAAAYGNVAERVTALVASSGSQISRDWGSFSDMNKTATAQAAEDAGVADVTYVRVKLRASLDRLAKAAARICGFPADSNHAGFVSQVIDRWAELEAYLEPASQPTSLQLDFVRTFDLDYRERRLRFVIRRINELYSGLEGERHPVRSRPDRNDLDMTKSRLWKRLIELRKVLGSIGPDAPGLAGDIARETSTILDRDTLTAILSSPREDTIDDAVEALTKKQHGALNDLRDHLKTYLVDQLATFGAETYGEFLAAIDGWDEDVRQDMLVRYLGFPYWDRLIYPIQAVADLRELNRIEVIRLSPNDVHMLGRCTARTKLKGVSRGHFGAFFQREYRENDYLWGRLDGSERLLWMLFDAAGHPAEAESFTRDAFRSILEQEEPHLRTIDDVFKDVRKVIDGELPAFPGCAQPDDQGSG